jgi:hypothetical protein
LSNKIIISANLFFFFLLISCKKSQIENTLICNKGEYWEYANNCGSYGVFFKFHKNGTFDKYLSKPISEGKGFDLFNNDGDVISLKSNRTWSMQKDSTFIWGKGRYKIRSCNQQKIVLTYFHYKEKNKKCTVTFVKVIDK